MENKALTFRHAERQRSICQINPHPFPINRLLAYALGDDNQCDSEGTASLVSGYVELKPRGLGVASAMSGYSPVCAMKNGYFSWHSSFLFSISLKIEGAPFTNTAWKPCY